MQVNNKLYVSKQQIVCGKQHELIVCCLLCYTDCKKGWQNVELIGH